LTGDDDDTVQLDSLLTDKQAIDAQAGLDTLIVEGGLFNSDAFDLRELSDNFHNIEVVDLSEGNFDVTIRAKDVLNISDASNTLQILGEVGDTVSLKGNWTTEAPQGNFNVYSSADVTLQIVQDVHVV